jgi:hypothetical protein
VDFRTGTVVWKRLAGVGRRYESCFPRLVLRAGIAYREAFDGLVAIKDTR